MLFTAKHLVLVQTTQQMVRPQGRATGFPRELKLIRDESAVIGRVSCRTFDWQSNFAHRRLHLHGGLDELQNHSVDQLEAHFLESIFDMDYTATRRR